MNLEQKTITSLEVAEMMEIRHTEVLRKLEGDKTVKGIIPTLSEHNFALADYFQESTYQDAQDKPRKCYLITKLGCDFLANKFTGEKGILFTAKYVKRFRDMEEQIFKPLTKKDELKLYLATLEEQEAKIEAVNDDLQNFKQDMPLLGLECDRITTAVKAKGVNCLGGKDSEAYQDKSLRAKVYSDIHSQIKRQFGVSTYKAIKRSQTEIAVDLIKNYELPMILADEINDCNAQMTFGEEWDDWED